MSQPATDNKPKRERKPRDPNAPKKEPKVKAQTTEVADPNTVVPVRKGKIAAVIAQFTREIDQLNAKYAALEKSVAPLKRQNAKLVAENKRLQRELDGFGEVITTAVSKAAERKAAKKSKKSDADGQAETTETPEPASEETQA